MQLNFRRKQNKRLIIGLFFLIVSMIGTNLSYGQSDLILQAYYWDVPVDSEHKNGSWYDSLNVKIPYLNKIGIQSIWLPPPSKGNWGIYDSGYGVYDHYDLGSYNQIGTIETRYGSEAELKGLICQAEKHNIKVIADVVLNHMYSHQINDLEHNPVIANYQISPSNNKHSYSYYPVNEIIWQIEVSNPGQYYFTVINDSLAKNDNWNGGFEISILKNSNSNSSLPILKYSNNTKTDAAVLKFNSKCRSKFEGNKNVKWFSFHAQSTDTACYIKLRLGNIKEGQFEYANQSNYIKLNEVFKGDEIRANALKTLTFTAVKPKSHLLEENGSWNYRSYHPSSISDELRIMGDGELVPNAKIFGHDFDHSNPIVVDRLINWGNWLLDSVGYQGVRLDFVQGVDPGFISKWFEKVTKRKGNDFFIVGEYFSHRKERIKYWADYVAEMSDMVNIKVFDFPLKFELTKMCNQGSDYDMRGLNHAGLLLDPIHHLDAKNIVSFIENHDTGKESDKWIKQNWLMAYAFIMMAPPQVCVYYNHLFPTPYIEMNKHSTIQEIPTTLPENIIRLIQIRKKFVGCEYIVLSNEDSQFENIFVSYSNGESNYGAFLILNNSNKVQKVKVKLPESLKENINDLKLVDLFGQACNYSINDGLIEISVQRHKISIWVDESEK